MKLIEAMKRVKLNKLKIADIQQKIKQHSAHTSLDTPMYDNTTAQVKEWLQACEDLSRDNVALLCQIQLTNLRTPVMVEVADKVHVTRSIAYWVWRRREYATLDKVTWSQVGDRGLKEGFMQSTIPGQAPSEVKIIRNYDPRERDARLAMFSEEGARIDAALEIANAITDLAELPQ